MTINERLYNLRKEKGLSQEQLANELNVSRQTVSKWETGESTPDFDKIIPLCEFYGITSDELLSGKKDIVEAKKEQVHNNFARNIAISVGLYICSLIAIILFAAALNQPIIGVCVFFFIIAIATTIIVYSSITYSKKKQETAIKEGKNTKDESIKLVTDIIGIIGLVAYFIISFATGAWYITWVIFLIIGLCDTIAKLVYSMKNKVEDKNE